MAAEKIIGKNVGNNSIDNTSKGGGKINTQNTNDRISTELWMQHFANALVNQNAIDEKTYKKLMAKINAEVNRRYNTH
ncbi:MAG: hypothetical protein ACLUFN_05575 [Eubacterium sp.]